MIPRVDNPAPEAASSVTPAALDISESSFVPDEPSTALAPIASPPQVPAPQPAIEPQVVTLVQAPLETVRGFVGRELAAEDLVRPHDKLKASIEAFLLDQRSEHTRRAYGKDLKRFIKYLLERGFTSEVGAIDRSLLIAYKERLLSDGLQHTSVDRHLATLRSFFQWLTEDGWIDKSPAANVRFLNNRKVSKTRGLTDEEVQKVLRHPNVHTRTGALHFAVLMTLFYTGLRRSELCAIRRSQITVERNNRIVRLQGKGNKERIIVVIEPVWRAIEHYLYIARRNYDPVGRGEEPLFMPVRNNRTGATAKPLDPSMIFYIVRKYARLAGIQANVSPHSCRATAISNARDHNAPDRAIQELAGWASTDMITRYDKRKTAIEDSAAHQIDYGETETFLPFTGQVTREPGQGS